MLIFDNFRSLLLNLYNVHLISSQSQVFNITGPLAQLFFKYSNAHFDVLVEPRCVTESFTPVVLRAKPGEPASHGLVRVFDHETGLVLYDEEVHDDSAFRFYLFLTLYD